MDSVGLGLLTLGLEVAFLLFVPDSTWYQKRLTARYDAQVQQRRAEQKERAFQRLGPAVRARFERLEGLRRAIDRDTNADWFRDVRRSLDQLLEQYLLFAVKMVEYRDDMVRIARELGAVAIASQVSHTEDPPDAMVDELVLEIKDRFERQIQRLDRSAQAETDPSTHRLYTGNIDLFRKRQEAVDTSRKVIRSTGLQMLAIENTFGLLTERLRAGTIEPQVLTDVDSVVSQAEDLTDMLQQLGPLQQEATSLQQMG